GGGAKFTWLSGLTLPLLAHAASRPEPSIARAARRVMSGDEFNRVAGLQIKGIISLVGLQDTGSTQY
ncbi:MAG TPA: hypothetical protein VGJ35_13205, partial [Burkholderiaceae bacterium]